MADRHDQAATATWPGSGGDRRYPLAVTKRERGRPRGGSKAATRARLITAARHCFADRGYDGAINREIAERAGVTASAIYQHFPTKRDLFVAVFEDFETLIVDSYEQALHATDTFADALCALIDESGKLHAADPSYAQFIVSMATEVRRHPELAPLSMANSRISAFLEAFARRAKATGEIDSDVDDSVFVGWMSTLIMALAQYGAASGDFDHWAQVADAVKRLMGAEAP